jgi:hypothetical protein
MALLSYVLGRSQLLVQMSLAQKNLLQKLEDGKMPALGVLPAKLSLLDLAKQKQRLGSPKHKLSSCLELVLQASGTFHRAVLPADNTDNNGKQNLEGLCFS